MGRDLVDGGEQESLQKAGPAPLPHSWRSLWIAGGLLALGALASGVLMLQFVRDRSPVSSNEASVEISPPSVIESARQVLEQESDSARGGAETAESSGKTDAPSKDPEDPAAVHADGEQHNGIVPELEKLPLDSVELESEANAEPTDAPAGETKPQVTKIAIIVDDGGYGGKITEEILAMDPSLTLAILPYAPYSAETARAAAAKGFEVLLHMPMECFTRRKTIPGSIETRMTEQEIAASTLKALAETPGAVGVNNHAGSKFSQNEAAMRAFLRALVEQKLFFVDSWTTGKSVGYVLAQEMGMKTRRRDLFLDNSQDVEAILKQTGKLVALAKVRGSAIGICHFRAGTARALPELIAEIKSAGAEMVHVSDLMP